MLIIGTPGELRETQRTRTAHVQQLRRGGRPQRWPDSVERAAAPTEQVTVATPTEREDSTPLTATGPRRHRRQTRSTATTAVVTPTLMAEADPQQTVSDHAVEPGSDIIVEEDPEEANRGGYRNTDNL